MSRLFSSVKGNRPPRNTFDLSHERKMSMNMGELTPLLLQEVVPGDRFKVNSEIFLRLAPMLAPLMHRVNVFTHYFFVPNRLVFEGWNDFITGGEDGLDVTPFPWISIKPDNYVYFNKGKLSDYFGLPIPAEGADRSLSVNALPFRGYQMIFNEYFRDQNLTPKVEYEKGSVVSDLEAIEISQMRRRAWEKDYFTSALPWTQRGNPVGLPIQVAYKDETTIKKADGTTFDASGNVVFANPQGDEAELFYDDDVTAGNIRIENLEEQATELTINDLRTAVRLQEWLEKNARGGARYIEAIKSHFGIVSSDSRLQRPEYLGGGKQNVVISEVLSHAQSEIESPGPDPLTILGDMGGHGISVGKTNSFSRSFEEHGFVFGIMSVIPRTAYQNGVEKMWIRQENTDYYWPSFSHLGEEAIENRELYYDWINAEGLETFGYQSRYASYKYRQSSVHGDFRDNLAFWHMGRQFDSLPALNDNFIKADPRTDIFAVRDEGIDKLYVQIFNSIKAVRSMPVYGTPQL